MCELMAFNVFHTAQPHEVRLSLTATDLWESRPATSSRSSAIVLCRAECAISSVSTLHDLYRREFRRRTSVPDPTKLRETFSHGPAGALDFSSKRARGERWANFGDW